MHCEHGTLNIGSVLFVNVATSFSLSYYYNFLIISVEFVLTKYIYFLSSSRTKSDIVIKQAERFFETNLFPRCVKNLMKSVWEKERERESEGLLRYHVFCDTHNFNHTHDVKIWRYGLLLLFVFIIVMLNVKAVSLGWQLCLTILKRIIIIIKWLEMMMRRKYSQKRNKEEKTTTNLFYWHQIPIPYYYCYYYYI